MKTLAHKAYMTGCMGKYGGGLVGGWWVLRYPTCEWAKVRGTALQQADLHLVFPMHSVAVGGQVKPQSKSRFKNKAGKSLGAARRETFRKCISHAHFQKTNPFAEMHI